MVFERAANPIFRDKIVFSSKYVPKNILHRGEDIKQIEGCLAYILMDSIPVSQTIYGIRGTGKTLIARYVTEELCKATANVKMYYISLKSIRTGFKAAEEIVKEVAGKSVRGVSFKDAFRIVFDFIKIQNERYFVFILDEINEVQELDRLFYYLLRPNEIYWDMGNKELAYIFITNDLKFPQNLTPGTDSSFTGVKKNTFKPYDSQQLKDILEERAFEGLQGGVYEEDILKICAAYGAQERGDARETIMLLEKAAELALQERCSKITENHVKQARQLMESDGTMSILRSLPTQLKTLALACVKDYKRSLREKNICKTTTVYAEYNNICHRIGIETLTQRRISSFLDELQSIGFIEMQMVYSRGRSKHIGLLVSDAVAEKVIFEDSYFESLKPMFSQKFFV